LTPADFRDDTVVAADLLPTSRGNDPQNLLPNSAAAGRVVEFHRSIDAFIALDTKVEHP
jgi:hypothetical protein